MQEKFNKNLEQVKKIISDLDSLKLGENKANSNFSPALETNLFSIY